MLERGMTVYEALYAWCRDCRDQGQRLEPGGHDRGKAVTP
jgi:hypothetical protein